MALVLEAAAVPEAELGAFLRRRGVHEAQLAEWRQQVTQLAVAGLRGPSKRDRKAASVEARRVRDLERELARKEKALAEAAALLVRQYRDRALPYQQRAWPRPAVRICVTGTEISFDLVCNRGVHVSLSRHAFVRYFAFSTTGVH